MYSDSAYLQQPSDYNCAIPADVYHENRVVPHFPPDPCIRPNEGFMMCQPEYPPCPLNYPCMPAAGLNNRSVRPVYQIDSEDPSTSWSLCREKKSLPCTSLGPITGDLPCPCSNRCPVFLRPKPYDLSLMYPKCVDRPSKPHFVTPLYNEPTPYIKWSSTSPEMWTAPQKCRVPFSEHLKCQCPNSAPTIGPNLIMFLQCSDY